MLGVYARMKVSVKGLCWYDGVGQGISQGDGACCKGVCQDDSV